MKAWNKKPWKTMESMGSMGIYKNESMGSTVFSIVLLLNNIQKAWKAWEIMKYKTMESMGSMGIYKNESMESMGSMVFSSMLLFIISRKHGKHEKHGKIAGESLGKHGIYAN